MGKWVTAIGRSPHLDGRVGLPLRRRGLEPARGTDVGNLRSDNGDRSFGVPQMAEEENEQEIAVRYRQSAEALRGIAATLRFDPRSRGQLLALANGFNRAAELIEKGLPD